MVINEWTIAFPHDEDRVSPQGRIAYTNALAQQTANDALTLVGIKIPHGIGK